MEAEIIAVGTEILMGEITNTNAQAIAQVLVETGFDNYYQSVVGDNTARIQAALKLALSRSEVIILSGGLGPTRDDITKAAIADYLKVKLVEDEESLAKIKARAARLQQVLPANNRAQALYLKGGRPLKNRAGLACGAYYQTQDHRHIIILPGPPREVAGLLTDEVQPLLRELNPQEFKLYSRFLRFFGITESRLAASLDDVIAGQTDPTLAIYLKGHEIGVRISTKATNDTAAQAKLIPIAGQIIQRLHRYYTGEGEQLSLKDRVMQALLDHHLTITAAESFTGGLFQTSLTHYAGVSRIFKGGWVTYDDAIKTSWLGVPKATISEQGVVSAEVAAQMAVRSRQLLETDFALSFTGAAGPQGLEGQPAGTVFIALAQAGHPTLVREYHLGGTRQAVRERSVDCAFKMLYDRLLGND